MVHLSEGACQLLLAPLACAGICNVVHIAGATFVLVDGNADRSLCHGNQGKLVGRTFILAGCVVCVF